MDKNLIKLHISDARNFHIHGMYDEAIATLNLIRNSKLDREDKIELYKLLSFNYRKLGQYETALYNINIAIQSAKQESQDEQDIRKYAICLMNKGVIYDEQNKFVQAIACYEQAVNLLISLYESTQNEYGIIINALINLGSAYYNSKQYPRAKEILQKALNYFGDEKQNDRRYLAIVSTLNEPNIKSLD